jgi:hypothetical protein
MPETYPNEAEYRRFAEHALASEKAFRIAKACALSAVAELRRDHNKYLAEKVPPREDCFVPYESVDGIDPSDPRVRLLTTVILKLANRRGLVGP